MPEELLPRDKKPGFYWLFGPNGGKMLREWSGEVWQPGAFTAAFLWRTGYRLASPHPIPGPEQLEELYRDAATTVAFRAALGAKP